MTLPGYDRWLESGPGGPYDDGDAACPHCDGGKVICMLIRFSPKGGVSE